MKIIRWLAETAGSSIAAEGVSWPLEPATDVAAEGDREREIEHEVTRLFDELRAPALRYLLSIGLSPADGEEVVQEVFLALFHHLRKGRPRTNLRGWVFRTAHNQGLKSRKRSQRRRALVAEADAAAIADRRPNVERGLVARQRLAKVQAVARALPDRDRWCLSLRAEGLSYREIAETLGVSLGAVSISIARSLARMREADR